jgi:class 3 adenylate cyclase
VLDRVLCTRLVGRDEQLFVLEDALLAAHRGESRLVALGGEAGMGKTRLATELAKRAQRLDWTVLWGACSEAELPIPYLPLVEALGNYLSGQDITQLRESLGAASRELAQLFPQLAHDEPTIRVGDPEQAKLRLFEAVVTLLNTIAHDNGLLLILEDVHWADSATRELLDHLCRRLTNTRSLLLLTYRSDELDRRHPLAPLLQSWRRSGSAELLTLSPLDRSQVAEMIACILEGDGVEPRFAGLMYARTEGNPFVLEEMLKELIDCGDLPRAGNGHAVEQLRIPDTVRDTILLRFARLDPAEAEVLQAAAVLGRTFDYATLLSASGAAESTVQAALQVGVAQQLLEETSDARASYRWRHALTQEAISDAIVLPRRQALHSRAANALQAAGADALLVASHLLGAARFEEAVPACLAAADEAQASLAFADALQLLERALPHVREPHDRHLLLCRMGSLLWMDNKPSAAAEVLVEGIAGLEQSGDDREAARYRLVLGRCLWEQGFGDESHAELERSRQVLERYGPSAELSLVYMRIANLYKFALDRRDLEYARKAVQIATDARADFERVWSQAFLAASLFDADGTRESQQMLDEAFAEAQRRGFTFIARNIAYNDTWGRLHTLAPSVGGRIKELASGPAPPSTSDWVALASTWVRRAGAELDAALEAIGPLASATSNEKVRWRVAVEHAEILLELGRLNDAASTLPPPSQRADLQDIIYDAAPQIRLRLETARLTEAIELAREIATSASRLAPFNDALAVAVEGLVQANLLDVAQAAVDSGRAHTIHAGHEFLDQAEARILLARGEAAKAVPILEAVARTAAERGFRLVEWRTRTLAADALAQIDRKEQAQQELQAITAAADAAHALLVANEARAVAAKHGLDLPQPEPSAALTEPDIAQAGERLVTSMFADVRGYTELTASTPPADMHEKVTTLYRWAAAEVDRHHGFVDKFAGDAVMATFNASGTRVDHAREALEAALALSGKAALLDLGIGIGISVGPAVIAPAANADGNISVLGSSTNFAARLQTAAKAGEIVLSEEAHRRVAAWLAEHGMQAVPEALELKGFDGPQPAWRLRPGAGA